jgi:hypothetical protein
VIRGLNAYLKRLTPARYALLGGLVAFSTDTIIFVAEGKHGGMAIGKGLVFALGAAAGCVFLARRFAETR